MALTQSQIDACAAQAFRNAADINAFFAGSGGFFAWYNAKLSKTAEFKHRGKITITPERPVRFDAFWDQIPEIFGRPSISALEFAALMCVSVQETSGNLFASPEKVGNAAHPGISYAFDAIPGLKSSYNNNPGLGNATARSLFGNAAYVDAHRALPRFSDVTAGGVDPQWGGSQWPTKFADIKFKRENESLNGFIMQADFYKLRGRGVIQTTGRSNYKGVIDFILTSPAAAANAVLNALRTAWNAFPATPGMARPDVIASRSTCAQWDQAFGEAVTLAAGVHLHSKNNRDFLDIGRTAAIVNAGTGTKGSFSFMARKINGGDYPRIVAPMMSAMAGAMAALASPALAPASAPAKKKPAVKKVAKKKPALKKAAKKKAALKKAAKKKAALKKAAKKKAATKKAAKKKPK
jgi:hypothetical protein